MGSTPACRRPRCGWMAAVLLVVLAAIATAQTPRDNTRVPFESAFQGFERTWVDSHVPAWRPARPAGQSFGAFVGAFSGQRRIDVSSMGAMDRSVLDLRPRKTQQTSWQFSRQTPDGFANGFDAFGNPAIGPVDVQAQARIYLKQQLITQILSRTSLGRSLGIFIDTGDRPAFDTRSRLIPFVSPKVNAKAGKAGLSLVWKF